MPVQPFLCIIFLILSSVEASINQSDMASFDKKSQQYSFLTHVGSYRDPVTGLVKHYYADGNYRTWRENKDYCISMTMEPVSPLSNEETLYLTRECNLTCNYYWTSGIQNKPWIMDLYTGFPIYDNPSWTESPRASQCAVIHRYENLHAMDCSVPHCTLCQVRVYNLPSTTSVTTTTEGPLKNRHPRGDNKDDFPAWAIVIIAIVLLLLIIMLYMVCIRYFKQFENQRKDNEYREEPKRTYYVTRDRFVPDSSIDDRHYFYRDPPSMDLPYVENYSNENYNIPRTQVVYPNRVKFINS